MKRKTSAVEEFDPRRVRPLPGQPRKRFSGIPELAASIKEVGQSCPGIVTLIDDDPKFDAQLVDGERRLRACIVAGVDFRAEVRSGGSIEEIFVASFAANFGKQDHDCIEIADGLARMQAAGKSVEQMARIAGKSDCWVYSHLNLLKLHPFVREMMLPREDDAPTLTFQVAQLLVPMSHKEQIALANRVVGKDLSLARARRVVLAQRSKSGDEKAYIRDRGPRFTLATLETLLEQFGDRIGIYMDMPGADLNQLIDALGARDRRRLIEQIGEAATDLSGLSDAIKARLPKLANRVAS